MTETQVVLIAVWASVTVFTFVLGANHLGGLWEPRDWIVLGSLSLGLGGVTTALVSMFL